MALSAKRPSRSQSAKAAALAAVADTGKKRRLNAEVDEALYKQIRQRALDENTTVSEITRQLWVEYLSK
jgi:hypothetical protein